MIIKDEIHGTMGFDLFEERIIDTPQFQRLRRVKQMSVTNLVYPGANHTRFEHSLGTAHLAGVIGKKLNLGGDELEKLRIYALLHDIGHVAFSHEGEDVLESIIGDHEEIGRKKMEKGELGDVLSERYKKGEIAKTGKSAIGSIIDSDIGADRMDYLKRDAKNTGVAYGIIDIDRIVHTLCLRKGELCIMPGGLEAAEYLLIARFMMFSTVYLHHTVRIATAMLYKAIEGSLDDGVISPGEFAEIGDDEAMMKMCSSDSGREYARALLNRNLYKEIEVLPRKGRPAGFKKLEKELAKKTGCKIIVDYPHPFHKAAEFRVARESGQVKISNISSLVRSLRESEGKRMKVLVLGKSELSDAKKKKIIKEIPSYLRD
jgi:hypothetical protein